MKRIIYLLLLSFIIVVDSFRSGPYILSGFMLINYIFPPLLPAPLKNNRFALNYRNQWPAVPGVFHTYSISFEKAMPNYNSGIGVLATYDVAGSGNLSTTNLGLLYSYDFNINSDWHIRPGVNFKFYYLGLDINKLIFNSQITGSGSTPSVNPPPFDKVADVDFATSALVYNERIWGGFTLDHLLVPKTSFYGDDATVPIKLNLYGGVQILKKNKVAPENAGSSFSSNELSETREILPV